ncbi:MAG: hypothetical protein E4H01_15525 [Lysobacterales bacterium]|nr:MAG: hypothetical protein E4H01_15525 [Xanthomonadales bacterium]
MLTLVKRRAPKAACHLTLHDLLEYQQDLLAVIIPPRVLDQRFLELAEGLRRVFDDDRLSLAASRMYGPDDQDRHAQLVRFADHLHIPLVATNDVHYHVPGRRALQDVLTCIRHGCTVREAGFHLLPNAERHLKAPEEMARLFADRPEAIARSVEIAERAAGFNLDELRYEYPDEVCPPGRTAMEYLQAVDKEDYYTLIVIDNAFDPSREKYSRDRTLIESDTAKLVHQPVAHGTGSAFDWGINYPQSDAGLAVPPAGDEPPPEEEKKDVVEKTKGFLKKLKKPI